MGLYGYARDTMPAVGAFAETAVVFDNCVVPRGSTRPSYASMLTGRYPFHHGTRTNGMVLHGDNVTLQEILGSAGYHTAAFVSNFVLVGKLSGFNQGFDVYDDRVEDRERTRLNYERKAGNTVKAILEWLASDPPQPFFLFTNFIDPHGPYDPPAKYRKLYRTNKIRILNHQQIPSYQRLEGQYNFFDYVDRYDAEIRYTDEAMGILIDELKRKGLWDEALVVFTADHGESFGEHGVFFEHHMHLWEETVRVPLAIRLPGSAVKHYAARPKRVQSLCSAMDLPQTLLAYLGLSPDVEFDGRNLLPLIGGTEQPGRMLLLEFPDLATITITVPDVYAVRSDTHKLVRQLDPNTGQLQDQAVFHVAADPLERKPIPFDAQDPLHRTLADEFDSVMAQVRDYKLPFTLTVYHMPFKTRDKFVKRRQQAPKTIVKTLTAEQAERLRQLGYTQ